jgi:hypothetical protein
LCRDGGGKGGGKGGDSESYGHTQEVHGKKHTRS